MNMFKPNDAETPKEYFEMLDEPRKSELKKLDALIRKTAPSLKPFMINGMVAYGHIHYVSPVSRKGVDWGVVLLSSRANYVSLYVCATDGKTYLAEGYKKNTRKRPSAKAVSASRKSGTSTSTSSRTS